MKNLITEFNNLRDFQKHQKIFDIIFYVESSSYYIYFMEIIKYLVDNYNFKVCYITSSIDDQLLKNNNDLIKTYYIGNGIVRTILFSSLDVKIMVMTMPDLNKYHIRRSNNQVHYVFIPHNLCSTHMVFRKGAFDYYDSFFCVGPHHVKELKEAEKLYKTKPKELVEIGYPRLDNLHQTVNSIKNIDYNEKLTIMIAPSWYTPGILDTIGPELIKLLLDEGHQVFVRPHRDSRLYISTKMDKIKNSFINNENFVWIEGKSTNKYLIKSHILITDWSGSGFSFSFGLGRPVISVDLPAKINNPEYKKFKNIPFEINMREKIGKVIHPNEIEHIIEVINDIRANYNSYYENIYELRNDCIYNFGKSAKEGAKYLAGLLQNIKKFQHL